MVLTCVLVGLSVGLASSFLAVGGGIFMVPALVTFLDYSRHRAVPTSLAVICMLSLINAIQFYRKGMVELRFGLLLGAFAATSAFISGFFATGVSSDSLAIGYVVALSIIALQSFRGDKSQAAKFFARNQRLKPIAAPIIGVVGGAASAFTGVSGGVVMAPYVVASNWVENAKVVPTVMVAMFMTSLAGVSAHVISTRDFGIIGLDAAIIFFSAAAVSSTLGQKYQHRLPARTRGRLLGTILLALIAHTLYQILSK